MALFSNKKKQDDAVTYDEEVEQTNKAQQPSLEHERQMVYYSFLFSGLNVSSDNVLEIEPHNTEFYNYICQAYSLEKFNGYMSVTDNDNTHSLLEQTLQYNDHFKIDSINNIDKELTLNKAVDWVVSSKADNIKLSSLLDLFTISKKGLLLSYDKNNQYQPHEILKYLSDNGMDSVSMQSAFSEKYFSVIVFKR